MQRSSNGGARTVLGSLRGITFKSAGIFEACSFVAQNRFARLSFIAAAASRGRFVNQVEIAAQGITMLEHYLLYRQVTKTQLFKGVSAI